MATHAPITGARSCAPFNPADWLTRFEAVGGGYTVTDHLSLCILVEGRSDAEIAAARRLINELSGADRRALVAHLRGRA